MVPSSPDRVKGDQIRNTLSTLLLPCVYIFINSIIFVTLQFSNNKQTAFKNYYYHLSYNISTYTQFVSDNLTIHTLTFDIL